MMSKLVVDNDYQTSMSETIDLPVLGMTCAACVLRVERAVAAVPGVTRADVNLPLSRARIEMEGATPLAAAAAIRAAGYDVPADALDPAFEHRGDAIARAGREQVDSLRRDATLAIALTIPLVAIAMLAMAGTWSVMTQLSIGTVVVVVAGRRYLRLGAVAVRHGSPDMNTLIALGAGTAWLWSTIASVRWLAGPHAGMPELYFEAGAAIVAFVMVGKLLESKARVQVSDAVRGLISLVPPIARRGDGDIDVAALVAGDAISVRPGERIAADGTVVDGSSSVDESMLTGESMPVDKAEGSPVYAGTLNHHGALVVRVARAGAQTALARIARAVEDAQGAKAPIARLADRVSAWFVPAVLVIAVATFGGWLVAGAAASEAVEHAVAVLVIACPCALGLATPAAVAVGTARAAELGVLFKGGDVVEAASRIDLACLDKTGTLTLGTPAVVSTISDEVLRAAASIEQASEHPLARAIVTAARDRDLALDAPHDVTVEAGGGIAATIGEGHARHRVAVGTKSYLATTTTSSDDGIRLGAELQLEAVAAAHEARGETVVFVSIDGELAGVLAIADPPAAEARATIAALRAMGIETVMISGDRQAAAQRIASEVGITRVHAEVKPAGKAAIVSDLRASHRVAMVGDGINDAPALAAADLGVAIGSGTDLAAAAADMTLLRGGIATLPVAFSLARETLRVIRRNLVAAFAYNAVCIPIAAAGLASPMIAAAAMSLSSVSVLASSLRLRRFAR